ncbi:PREDICTED: stAR-related lipid transfer protein 9 [Phaethon lepturus]|uniref:stAR-related lipid transfer protein 9 n=1 Tax=Phaethon lepturus TaxID=97097 RepID=UPI000530420C|nr:PREDICTED: stAR-related lipid transfer protein 9 [Phaethon lepturus]
MGKMLERTDIGEPFEASVQDSAFLTNLMIVIQLIIRESAEGGRVIVEVDDKVAKVRNIKVDSRLDSTWDSREKTVAFSFDYCYWSVDPEDPKYASQEMVFQDLGTSVLSGAFKGYNICLFAYGQTGSGKTYTMMGTPASIGLTPRICEGLFSRKDDYSDQTASCRVKVSFLEIYNERVRDLLKQSDQKKPYTLRVREHPETGPYVQGLTQHLVTDYKQVVELLEEGIAKRITAATHIHNASSRSHAIFTIHYTQAILENNLPSEIASKINLVDLAGSERADPSYCKDRITEGANINKSLVTLGIVISTLAQNSQMFSSCQSINTLTSEGESSHTDSPSTGSVSGTRRPAYIPYRDSILTWLLKDSLGGNSKTIMIATISPASSSYNETMSTLRYASNAKNIINKPRVNEDANVKLIRELREEIDRLKTMLMSFELRNSSPSWSDDRDGNLTELVLQNEMRIDQLTKDWTSKWTDRKAIMEEYSVDINKEKAGVTIDSSLPHLMAMDDDILSTGVVLYHLREGTTKIGRSDSDQDQDIVLQGQWIERNHCMIDNNCGIVTLRPVQGAHCTVNGCEVTGSCRLSQGALVVLGKSHKFRFNHPAEAAILRQRRSINETPPILSCGALDWLNLDRSCTRSPQYILSSVDNQKCRSCKENKRSPELSREIDAVHEEYKQKLRDQEAFHRKQIQQQQLYVEELKQQILRGQIKAEQELENDQALINQQIQENQQWLINENKRLAALQQQQREFAVQTESTLYAEAEVQSTIGLEICPSLLQQNKKRLVQLELLRRYSLKKAERNIRRKKVKFQLERIVKKQKLLEAKQNLEQLEASCWLNEECVKQSEVLNENTAVQSSSDHQLQKRRKSLGSSSLQHRQHSFCNPHLPQVPSCLLKRETFSKLSTSPNIDQCCEGSKTGRLSSVEYLYRKVKDISGSDDLNDEKGISFSVQRQLTEKQKTSSFGNKKGAEKYSNDSAIMAYINKNDQKIEKLDHSPGQAGSQKQTSKGSSPDLFKMKDEPETFITGTRMTKAKMLGDLSQPARSNLEQNRAQVCNKKTRMDINRKGHRSPENFPKEIKKTVYGNPPSAHLNQTAKNWKTVPDSALPTHEKSSAEQQEFLMVATSVGNLTKVSTQAPLSYVEKKWHSAEMLSSGMSKTAMDVLGNWQEDDENEISDTDSSYSVDSLSCAYAKAFTEKLKQEDFDRNKCFANPEDSESDDSQMSQDSLVEKENKAKKQNRSRFHKSKAHHDTAKLYKSRTDYHVSSLVTSYTSRRRLGKPERSFSLDSLADGEEMPAEDPVEESKSDSSDEVPAEIFWKLQTPRSPTIQTEEDHESKTCDRDTEGTNYDLNLSSSFYLDTKPQPDSSNACKQLLKGTKVSFVEQERSLGRRLYYTSGNPLLATDAWSSCDSKVDTSSPRITAPSSNENLEFQEVHLCSLSKPELWLKKDDLKQSAAEVSFVSGSKQIHSITRLSHRINEINTVFSSDISELPLPETTTTSRASESGSLNKILKGWTNCNENSSLESQDVMTSFVSSVEPSSSFVPISANHDYYDHSKSNHPEQEQPNELSTSRSTTECAQTFSCLESASTMECLSLVSGKEEDCLPTTHPELPKDHNLKKTPFSSVLPVHILEQRNGCVDAGLEDDFFRTFEKDDLDDDCNNFITKSSIRDSGSRSAPISAPAAESSTGLAYNTASPQTTAVKQVEFGNHAQLFPRREIPSCCDEGFFLSDLTNKNCSLVRSYELQTLAGQGAESAVTVGLLRSGESNLETMQETDYGQISAEEVTTETDFSSQKTTYRCNSLVVAHSASYDQSATPIEMSQKEIICMETSTDSLAEVVPEVPSFRDNEEYKPKDEDLSSLNHYEFKSKPVSKNYFHECALADSQESCLSQQISENSTLCTDNIREESSESKEHNALNSRAVVQKDFSSKYEDLVVNEVSYLIVNVNGKDTESFPAAVCESTNDFLPESNSSVFYQASTKANLFQSASETENYDKLLEHVTKAKADCDVASNLTVEVSATEGCSDVHSGSLCTTCSSKSMGQKNNIRKTTDISMEFDATILLETEKQNESLLEPREERESFFESDCPEDILLVEDDVNSKSGGVFEYNTNTAATVSQEENPYINKESNFLRNPETDPEEIPVPYQNTKANADEEITKFINSVINLGKNALEIKSRQIESLPDYPVAKVQSVTEDRSGEDLKSISLSQNPKKPIDILSFEVQCEFYTNLCLTHEEVEKEEPQVAGTGVECTRESKALVRSGSRLETSSFCQKEKCEKMEIDIYSPELSVAPQNTPSAVCSHTTDFTQNASGFLDACDEGLLQRNGIMENVFDTEDVAAMVLITGRQGNILAKLENEGQVNSSNLTERCVPNCLPQEDKVNECKVTGSEEQIIMTNTEGLIITRQEVIHTDENVSFTEESPALHQKYCDRHDKEEILNQFKIPERYLTASGLEHNILLEDDSTYYDPTEMSEDGGSVDSIIRNAVMKDIDVCEYSVDDVIGIDQYRIEQEFKSLHVKEDSRTYMSCSTQYPEHSTSENLNVSIVRKRADICELEPVGSRVEEEKVHLMDLEQTAKTDKEKQMFVENTEEVELTILQNRNEVFPENRDSCQMARDDKRFNEILRVSQWVSTSFSRNNEDISKRQNPPATVKPTEKSQEGSRADWHGESANHLLYLGVSDDSHLVQDVPTALKGHTKPRSSSAGAGAILPYYETLMESEVCGGTPVTVNKTEDDKYLSAKTQSENVTFLQTRITQVRQEKECFAFNDAPDCAVSGQPAEQSSSSTPYSAGGPEPETVALQQGAEGNSFSLEKLDSSEDIIQDVNNACEEHSVDLMVNKLSKDCLNSIEDTAQEEKGTIVPDPLLLDNSNLLSSPEEEVMEGIDGGGMHSLLEISSPKTFDNINTTPKVLHSGTLLQHGEAENFLSTSYDTTNSKKENAEFSDVAGYQHDPRENQGHATSEERCVDQPGSTVSENASTLSEEFLNYNRNSGTSECSPGLLNHPASFADVLIASNGDKGKNNAILSEETKYFESESTDLSVSVTFPDVSQQGDERKNNSAVAEATYAQNNKIPEKAVGTDEKGKIIQGTFQHCNDIKENKMHEHPEDNSDTSRVTVPESGSLTLQSQGQTGSKESKSLPSYLAEDTPTDTPFQSSKNFSGFDTSCLLGDSKSLIFSHLEDSLQDTFLTEQIPSSSADVRSVKEGDSPHAFASVNHPPLAPFSESYLNADIGHGETGMYDISHTSILKHSPFAVLQIQDTQSDKAVVFDEPIYASGSILLSLAKENRHCPVSDTDSTSYKNSAVDGEPAYGSNCEKIDNDTKVDQYHWDKVPPLEACTEHIEKVLGGNDCLLLPSSPFWDTGRAITVKEGQMRKILNRSEEELHSNTEAEHFAVKTEQRKTLSREPVEKQTKVSSNSADELIDPEITVVENLYPGDVNVDPEHTCNSFSATYPTYSTNTDPRQLYHTVLGFEKKPADLQDSCQYVPTGEQVPDRTHTDGRKEILICKNNTGSSVDSPDADADNCSTTGDAVMRSKTLKSEGLKFSVMNNEGTSIKFLPENHDLPPQESKSVQFRSKRSYSTTRNTKSCKQSEQRPYLQSHRLSAPAIAVFSDLEYTSEASPKVDPLLYSASKSLQDLNMSVEPPSPTDDDLHGIERFSKQESKNFLQVKSNPIFEQRMAQTKQLANCDPKNLQNFAARTQSSQSLKVCTTHSPSPLLHTAHSSVGAAANIHSKSSSVAQCSEGKVEEAGYQPETDLFLQDNKDSMHFSSSDINPYIHPWQQDGLCKIGWKQYVFGSASDVSCNQIPLNLENHKVMRCSSVDNGLNAQNSPFHSHLSSYATAKVLSSTLSSIEGPQGWDNVRQDFQSAYSSDSTKQYSNISSETLETNPENNTPEFENPAAEPGNSSMQVDEIVLLYPSESEKSSKKLPGITCEQGTQTATTGRYKRQRRHQRSYTDVSARKQETNRDLFHQPSSWTSMQNLSMHLSQLLQNTSELLGNLSQQSIIDNEQNAKINQRGTEKAVKAARSDSCTQTTADVGTQTEILEEPQSKHEEKQVEAKMENELRAAPAVNIGWKGIGADTAGKIPKRKEETLSFEERTQERTGMRKLGNPDFYDSLDSILEDSFMRLPLLPRTSTPILDFRKTSLNAQQNVAFASTRVSSVTPSSLSSGQDGSSCTVVSSPTNSTFQSPASYAQDKRSVDELEVPAERKFCYKNTLLVDRASSPILTLSASPSSQTSFSKSVCPVKEPLGYSSDPSSPLHNQRKQRAGPWSSMQPHVDNFSQTETDSESSASRDSKGIRKKSGSFSDKKAAKELLEQDCSKDLEQQHRRTVDSHTTICAKRLYHSSSMLEVSGHREVLTDDLTDRSPLARSLRCMYVTRGGRGSSAGIGHEKYVGNSDTALIHNSSPPKADLVFNQKMSTTHSSKTNADVSLEPLVEATSLQFHNFFWKNENSCPPPLSDASDMQTSFQDNNTDSVTESECDTEILLNKNTAFAKPYRPRSYSLRDLPIHNKFSNWCGVTGSPPPSLLSLSGSVTDLQSQAEKKPRSTRATEMEKKSQLCDSRSREIESLQRERAQIMSGVHLDLHQHPLTVELTEAKLNYSIGETDALLRVLQSGTADDLVAIPVKQQLYERHMRTIETLRKEREKRLQRYQRSRSLSPQKHLSLLQTLDASQRDPDLPSRRREYLQQLRRDVVENTRVQEPKRRSIQHPSDIELLLRDYQRAREETKTEIARARDKLRERAEQEKRRIQEQIFSQLQKEEARLKTLASTSTLCTDSSLSLSSGPTSGYNSSNTATYTASNLSSQEGQVSSGNALLSRDTRGRSAVRNSQLYVLEQLQKDTTFAASRIHQPPLPSSSISCRFTHGLTISVSSSSTKGYQDLSKHILANATTEVMAACSHNLRNLYTCQAAAGWKYQCTEKEVLVYYKVFPSATRHGFLGAGVIERPLPSVWGLVRDPGKRHLYDRTINTARIHKKVTSHIQLVYLVTDSSLCYLKQPRDFCCITVEAEEENLSVLAVQSVYDASMPHPCKEVVRGEILPSAWILEPDVVNGREITRVIYMAQVDLGAPAIPARLLSSIAKRQPLVIARLAHFLAS